MKSPLSTTDAANLLVVGKRLLTGTTAFAPDNFVIVAFEVATDAVVDEILDAEGNDVVAAVAESDLNIASATILAGTILRPVDLLSDGYGWTSFKLTSGTGFVHLIRRPVS